MLQDRELLRRFALNETVPEKSKPTRPEELVALLQQGAGMPVFKNNRKLRDYQEKSFKWMVQHLLKGDSCILGDEMGLGACRHRSIIVCPLAPSYIAAAKLHLLFHFKSRIRSVARSNESTSR